MPSLFVFEPKSKTIKVEINHRCRIEGEHLAENETTSNGDAERPPEL
jgi:hypothetical protein